MSEGPPRFWVVGLGRVGSLIARLAARHEALAGVTVKDASDVEHARSLAPNLEVTTEIPSQLEADVVVLLCVPDRVLTSTVAAWGRIARAGVVHFSGAFGTAAFAEYVAPGVTLAGLHPLLSVSTSEMDVAQARGVTFGLSGYGNARSSALLLAEWLGGHVVEVDEASRAAWHLAATIASNGVYALLNVAMEVAASAGITGFDVERGLASLAGQSAQSASIYGAVDAATGPVVRGDATTVDKHLRVLAQQPDARSLYVELTRALLDIAEIRGTNESALVAIRSLIESTPKP